MIIKVKSLTGREIELEVEENDQIIRVKELIEEQSGVPPNQQRLIFNRGDLRPDEKTLAEFGIEEGSVLRFGLGG